MSKVRKYFKVDGPNAITLESAVITINLEDYKNISEDYGEDIGMEETESAFKVPGFFKVHFPRSNHTIEFFFPYTIYLNKTSDYEQSSKQLIIRYEPNDIVFYARYKEEDTNIRVLDSVFENGNKYLGNHPDRIIASIWQQLLANSNVPIHHLELIVQRLYAKYDSKSGKYIPLRLTNEKYTKDFIMNTKESSHRMNNSMGFLYGHSNDALRTSVSKSGKNDNSFFENILGGNYDKLIDETEKYKKKE